MVAEVDQLGVGFLNLFDLLDGLERAQFLVGRLGRLRGRFGLLLDRLRLGLLGLRLPEALSSVPSSSRSSSSAKLDSRIVVHDRRWLARPITVAGASGRYCWSYR
jgi:hypothetical protein